MQKHKTIKKFERNVLENKICEYAHEVEDLREILGNAIQNIYCTLIKEGNKKSPITIYDGKSEYGVLDLCNPVGHFIGRISLNEKTYFINPHCLEKKLLEDVEKVMNILGLERKEE